MLKCVVYAAITLTALPCAAAPGDEHWIATSNTATAVTGDVTLGTGAIVFSNGASLQITRIRNGNFTNDSGKQVPASIYRIIEPLDPLLLGGNALCGRGNVSYLAIWHVPPYSPGQADGRALAVYTGRNEPAPTARGSCGTYYYEVAAGPVRPVATTGRGIVQIAGKAVVGSMTRPAQFEISCVTTSGKLNTLSFTLLIKDAPSLKPVFDVDPVEGPGAKSVPGELTAGSAKMSFSPGGSFVSSTDFTFSGGFSPTTRSEAAGLRQARTIVSVLSQGPNQLTWRIGNPNAKGAPIEATFSLTDSDGGRIRSAAGLCSS